MNRRMFFCYFSEWNWTLNWLLAQCRCDDEVSSMLKLNNFPHIKVVNITSSSFFLTPTAISFTQFSWWSSPLPCERRTKKNQSCCQVSAIKCQCAHINDKDTLNRYTPHLERITHAAINLLHLPRRKRERARENFVLIKTMFNNPPSTDQPHHSQFSLSSPTWKELRRCHLNRMHWCAHDACVAYCRWWREISRKRLFFH
jgi:hypothetical protein